MGYVSKTLSKDESLIKRAHITFLSILDKVIIAAMYIIGGLFSFIIGFLGLTLPVGDPEISLAAVGLAVAGALLLCIGVVLGIYKLVQKIAKLPEEITLSAAVPVRFLLYGLLGVVIGVVCVVIGNVLVSQIISLAVGIVVAALVLVFSILRYRMIFLVVTDKRIFGKRNIWRTEAFDIPIDRLTDIQVKFSFWGKLFNYGIVKMYTANSEHVVKYVNAPEQFKNLVLEFSAKYDKTSN